MKTKAWNRLPGARWRGACLLMVLLLGAGGIMAATPGRIIKTDETIVEGQNIRWLASRQQYVVRRDSIELNIDLADVATVDVKEPQGLRGAVGAVQKGQPNAAIPVLRQIVKDYTMLRHDITAARWLGTGLLKKGQAHDAATMLQELVDNYGFGQLPGELISIYIDALTEDGKTSQVKSILKIMIEEGSRGAAAVALVKRGDLYRKEGKYKEALIQGYLRVIVLFEEEKHVQPESLYYAAKCCEELGQVSYAEKMRKELMEEFPQSSYTRQTQSGT